MPSRISVASLALLVWLSGCSDDGSAAPPTSSATSTSTTDGDARTTDSPSDWPDCGDEAVPSWPGVGPLIYMPDDDAKPAELTTEMAALATALAPELASETREEGEPGCHLTLDGETDVVLGIGGRRDRGYALTLLHHPAMSAVDPRGSFLAQGNRIEVPLPTGKCSGDPACSFRVSVRYGDVEESSTVPVGTESVVLDLARDPDAPGAVVISVVGPDGQLSERSAFTVSSGDFAAG